MSRVMARGLTSLNRPIEKLMTLVRQSVRVFNHARFASSAGRSRKKCSVSSKRGGLAVDLRDRVDQLVAIQLVAAGVALVAARTVGVADRAFALDVAVGQRAPGGGADRHLLGALIDVSVLQALLEQLLHHLLVVAGGGAGEQVVAQAQVAQVLGNHAIVPVSPVPGRSAPPSPLPPGSGCRARRCRTPSARHCPSCAHSAHTRPRGRRIRPHGRYGGGRSRTARQHSPVHES